MSTKAKKTAATISMDHLNEMNALVGKREALMKLLAISRGNSNWHLATNFLGQWSLELEMTSTEIEKIIKQKLIDTNAALRDFGVAIDRDAGTDVDPVNKVEPEPEPAPEPEAEAEAAPEPSNEA